MARRLRGVVLALALLSGCDAEKPDSPPSSVFPERTIKPLNAKARRPRQSAPFTFLVAGHVYGDWQKKPVLPPAGLRRYLAQDHHDDLIVLLGDSVYRYAERGPTMEFLKTVPIPVYNAPGNHDYTQPRDYEKRYGPSYGGFMHGGSLFVVLNTEVQPWHISKTQLRWLDRVMAGAVERDDIERVFVFAHKLVFAANERYLPVLLQANESYPLQGPNNFDTEVRPLLSRIAKRRPVTWFSGDVGTPRSMPLFRDQDPESGITYVATGLGDNASDHLLRIAVPAEGPISITVVPLAKGPSPKFIDAGLEAWRARLERK
ncbi:MAG: hypothetical protein CMJ83_16055 [Planctomycetes bacterium]|nr:hypothetical protein [Planctomycetota bacterium]